MRYGILLADATVVRIVDEDYTLGIVLCGNLNRGLPLWWMPSFQVMPVGNLDKPLVKLLWG